MNTNTTQAFQEEPIDLIFIKEIFLKLLTKWQWFLLSIFIFMLTGLVYTKFAPSIYLSKATVKIIDDSKGFDFSKDPMSLLTGEPKVNLDNEIAILKSYRLLEQVVSSLNLDVEYYDEGNIINKPIFNSPVIFRKLSETTNYDTSTIYKVTFEGDSIKVLSPKGEEFTLNRYTEAVNKIDSLEIIVNKSAYLDEFMDRKIIVELKNKKQTVLDLIDDLKVEPHSVSGNSDMIALSIKNENFELSEAVLNELIDKFNKDGVMDRQLVSQRTLDFIDDRFVYLSKELDSIETGKKNYKQLNNLSYIEADAGITLEKKSLTEEEVARIQTQIELSKLLKSAVKGENKFSLIPANIGVENSSINSLVSEYNEIILEREKLITSAGINNPSVKLLSSQLTKAKLNIVNTVNTYQNQLKVSLKQLKRKQYVEGARFSKLPEKEKSLRAIERQQLIKENLFLLLLQKREEAAIQLAITAPSIKVVDYALTSLEPVSPQKTIILSALFLLAIVIPLSFFFVKFYFDNTIETKADVERIGVNIPILGEIPFIKKEGLSTNNNLEPYQLESFRILVANIKYMLLKKKNDSASTIFVTSTVQGEGKTTISTNISKVFSSLNKKTLLIGADLRNPQLHNTFGMKLDTLGLSNYLHDSEINWKDCIHEKIGGDNLDVCFSGPIPPNSSQLISGPNLGKFLNFVSEEYDYIIVDTPPILQVADTLLMSDFADATIYVTRSKYTEKRLIEFSSELSQTNKLKNMAYVLNGIEFNKRIGYNYGYEYKTN